MGGVKEKFNIAIDGLPASGKDTITEILFYTLNHLPCSEMAVWRVIDSSAMWRATSLYLHEVDVLKERFEDSRLEEILQVMENIHITSDFRNHVEITEKNTGKSLRIYDYSQLKTAIADRNSGYIATISQIRPFIVAMEREIARQGYTIVPGRDGYSVVLQNIPDTVPLGVYVYADFEVRVDRRVGKRDISREKIAEEMKIRDERDTSPTGANCPKNIPDAEERGYLGIDTTANNIYEMGIIAVKACLEKLRIAIPQNDIQRLVHKANLIYNHKI